jgi:hypothetical protein
MSAPEHAVSRRAWPVNKAGETTDLSHEIVAALAARNCAGEITFTGCEVTPESMIQVGLSGVPKSDLGNGCVPAMSIGNEAVVRFSCATIRSANGGALAPDSTANRFAIRNGSASAARSSSNTPGVTTKITSVVTTDRIRALPDFFNAAPAQSCGSLQQIQCGLRYRLGDA